MATATREAICDVTAPAATAVRALTVSRVVPSPLPEVEHAAGRVKLSFFDAFWIALPPTQLVFLYELPAAADDGEGDGFLAAVTRLKDSLAATLAHYRPLAGKLAYSAETGDVVVDMSANAGVAFVEAEAEDGASMDVRRLAGEEAQDTPAFLALVPELDTRVLPAPVLSVQATRLGGGGLAVGVSVHHAVVDGRALWQFVEAWASASREGSPVTKALAPPHYNRDAIPYPGNEVTRDILNMMAPNLPVVVPMEYDHVRFRLPSRTFFLSADDIQSLKQRINELASRSTGGDRNDEAPKPVSTFVALSALGWTAFVQSKGLAAKEDTYLIFPADLRSRLDPPVGEGYLGNCVRGCIASCGDARDLTGEAGLLHAVRAVQAATIEMEAAPLAGTDRAQIEQSMLLPFSRLASITMSPRFPAYGMADLGFGRPMRVENVSMNRDGEMVLFGGRHDGEVQISVSLDPTHMDAFMDNIFG